MTRRTPFTSGVLVSGLAALGWLMTPGCGGGSPKSDGGAGAGGLAGAAAGHPGAGAGGGVAGASGGGGAGGGAAGSTGTAGAGGNGGAAGSTAGAGGNGGAAGGSAGATGTAGAGGNGGAGTSGSAGAAGSAPDAGCTTSFGAANEVLYDFSDGKVDGWAFNGQGQSIVWSGAAGHTCLGAVQLVLPGVSSATSVLYNFLPSANWVGASKLHVWVSVQTTHYAAGTSLLLYVQTNGFTDKVSDYQDVVGSAFTDGGFHELVLDLTTFPSAQDLKDVDVIALAVSLPNGDAGTLAPVTVSIDDLWLEPAPVTDAGAGN
ncbi:MAG TPA: hypothetical protein VGP64_16545 [Polyangia bacterium]|jgi:hypothetical protein